MSENYYIILGIPFDSSQEDIKAAYRRLAKEFHPDHFGVNYAPFLSVQEAYAVLSDPVQRRRYDLSLQKSQKIREKPFRVEPLRTGGRQYVEPLIPEKKPVDLGKVHPGGSFAAYRPSFEELFDGLFGSFVALPPGGEMPQSLQIIISLAPEQARRGGYVRLQVPDRIQCPACRGQGGAGSHACRRCGGEGFVSGERPVILSYPPGVPDNHSVKLVLDRYGIITAIWLSNSG